LREGWEPQGRDPQSRFRDSRGSVHDSPVLPRKDAPEKPGYDTCRGNPRNPSVSDSRLDAKANRILHRNNAQEIVKALADLEEHRAEFATRWLWELIQNARDFPDESRPMTIRISVSPEQIRFAHNGRDFSEDVQRSNRTRHSSGSSGPASSPRICSPNRSESKERCSTTTAFGKPLNSTSTDPETTPNRSARRCNGRSRH
jgi:hypothetical protein